MLLRIATTQIEQFRLVRATEWASEQELIEQINGKFVRKWQMEAGTALHSILEKPRQHQVAGAYRSGDYSFAQADIAKCQEALDPRGVFEVKHTLRLQVGSDEVDVVAKCDQFFGTTVHENKTKFGQFDITFYEPGLQWRFYCLVLGAAKVQYNVHLFGEPDQNGLCEMKSIERFAFWPYVGIREDCMRWLTDFVGWAKDRELTHRLDANRFKWAAF